jgi:isochorismate synthase EntC
VTLFELLRALHPTPAVGGFPEPAALAWLAAHGERRAAWYSGGIGSLAPDGDGEIAVPLRSALLHGQWIELQAGAGIVDGSDPSQELAETEAKFATLLDALDATTEKLGREAG